MEIKKLLECYKEFDQKEVIVYGWIRNKRTGKNVCFINLNDGTCFETIQIVYLNLSNQEEINKSHLGSAIKVVGKFKLVKENSYEIEADSVEVLAESRENYPLQPKKHSYEFLREIAHLRVRTNTFNAVFKIRSLLSFAIHEYFNKNGFTMVHSPIITAGDGEGAGEMFNVSSLDMKNVDLVDGEVDYSQDFFNKKTHLTVTGQLQAEAYALAFSKVYTFGPTFRAEKSNTTRHAAEFWMIEPEIAFADLNDVIKLAKDLLIYAVDYVLKHAKSELEFLDKNKDVDVIDRLNDLVNSNFQEITYKKAIEILKEEIKKGVKFENDVYFGVDLATEHERHLTDNVFRSPLFVTDYPSEIKAFYMRLNDDNETVSATDLLVPGIGELLGGSQREERLEVLVEKMNKTGLDPKEFEWYLDLRRYGGVKHSGFGIGFERLVMYVTGMENIRDVIAFPRTVKNCEF